MSIFCMSKIVLRALASKPATHRYPAQPRTPLPGSRGLLEIEIDRCIFCSICVRKCPTAAIEVNRPERAWTLDRLGCISCGACVEACPKKCLRLSTAHGVPTVKKDREVHIGPPPAPRPTPS